MKSPRQISRELSLLSLSQLPASPEKLSEQEISNLLVAAIRTLSAEVQDALETAAGELQRSNDRLLNSETRAIDVQSSKAMVKEAIELTQLAINRVAAAYELPEFIQLSNQREVRDYALQIIRTVKVKRTELDTLISKVMVNWQINRLAQIDRDILRIGVCEIWFLGVPDRVAINEAVELAKRYSGEDGYRFINKVLGRASEEIKSLTTKA